MSRISTKNQVTLPVETLRRAGLQAGDDVAIEAEGEDRIVVRRADARRSPEDAFGIFDGLYAPDYLEKLRAGERA
jgi:bifunctional DNA-binding transcriptional regulator/antitoxin component of YhaV-PrlF toxin-antitoxin module